jgi:hypothetical protein
MIEFTEDAINECKDIFSVNGKFTSAKFIKLSELGFIPDHYKSNWFKEFLENFFNNIHAGARYTQDEIDERINVAEGEMDAEKNIAKLTQWLASDENRITYLTSAMVSTCNTGEDLLWWAQYQEMVEVIEIGRKFLEWFVGQFDDGIDDEEMTD